MFLYLNDSTDSMASSANATSRTATTPWYHSFALENILRLFRNANLLIKAKQSGRFDWVEEFSNRKYLNDHSLWQKMRSDAQYDWGAAWREDSWKAIEIWVSKMLTLTVSTHTDIWFVVLPAAPQVQIGVPSMDLFVPQKSAAAMADRLRIRLLDPLSYLRDNIDKDYLYYDQCHFTALGNKAMSDFLVPRLKEWVNTRAK